MHRTKNYHKDKNLFQLTFLDIRRFNEVKRIEMWLYKVYPLSRQ